MVTRVSDTVVNGHVERQFAQDVLATSGLDFGINDGLYVEGLSVTSVEANVLTLADDEINYVYLNTSSMFLESTTGSFPSADFVPMFVVTTSAGAIANVDDVRSRLISSL